MISGQCADIGKFKGPILRSLAARAPYFHNGSARTLADVVTFYDQRFKIGFTEQEKKDLAAFLASSDPRRGAGANQPGSATTSSAWRPVGQRENQARQHLHAAFTTRPERSGTGLAACSPRSRGAHGRACVPRSRCDGPSTAL